MRRWLGFGGLVGVVGTLASIACSGASEPYPDVQSFCAARASAECQVAAQCLANSTACANERQSACMTAATQATSTGTRVYTAANATTCLTTVQAAYAAVAAGGGGIPYATAPGSMTPSLQSIDAACEAVFLGTIPANGKCKTDFDCAQSADSGVPPVCAPIAPGSTTTECTEPVEVPVNMPCANFGSVCATGSYCHGSPAICRAGSTSGSCSPTAPCGLGAFCNMAQGAKSGTCETGLGPGAACASSVDCGPSAPYCDPNVTPPAGAGSSATGSCVPALFSLGSSSDDCKAYGRGM